VLNNDIESNNILRLYLPVNAVDYIARQLLSFNIQLIISKPRLTKTGDYMPPAGRGYHRISVNSDLNKFSFLITLLHEIAHALIWIEYRGRVKPHGKEWKYEFSRLLEQTIALEVFPGDIVSVINKYLVNKGNFTRSSLDRLNDVLRLYNKGEQMLRVMDIPGKCTFILKGGREFVKIRKLRKRYRCRDARNGRFYSVSPYAEIISYR